MFLNIAEDKGDSPGGLDSDSSSSSPAPPSGHRTGSSVSLSGSHYQSATGLIKGNIQLNIFDLNLSILFFLGLSPRYFSFKNLNAFPPSLPS